MNLKKEIKLSGLGRRQRKQEIVGLKIGASQIAVSRVVNNGGSPKLAKRVVKLDTRLMGYGYHIPF